MDEIERLLELGHMDLEAGYPEYARQYFEKVLALDASNQEAIEGLAQVDKALEHKAFFESLETQAAKPANSDRSITEWIRDKFRRSQEWVTKSVQRAREKREDRDKEFAKLRERFAKQEQERAEEKAREIEKVKQAWAEERVRRGNVPLQLGQCPECGSMNSYKHKEISGVGCLAMVLFFPVSLLVYLLLPDTFLCRVCGAKWKG